LLHIHCKNTVMASQTVTLSQLVFSVTLFLLFITCTHAYRDNFHKFRGQKGSNKASYGKYMENDVMPKSEYLQKLGLGDSLKDECLYQFKPCNPYDDQCCPGMRCLNYAQGYCLKGLENCACFPTRSADTMTGGKMRLDKE